MTKRPGTVFIAEDSDDEDRDMLSGLFSAHWESEDYPVRFRDGPRGVPVDDAVAWGRDQADVVLVRAGEDGETFFSAGARQPEGERLPEWEPALAPTGPRRMPGLEYLDRTDEDPPVAWRVELEYPLGQGDVAAFARAFAAALEAESNAAEVGFRVAGEGVVLLEFQVTARSVAEADALAEAIEGRASPAAWPALGGRPATFHTARSRPEPAG